MKKAITVVLGILFAAACLASPSGAVEKKRKARQPDHSWWKHLEPSAQWLSASGPKSSSQGYLFLGPGTSAAATGSAPVNAQRPASAANSQTQTAAAPSVSNAQSVGASQTRPATRAAATALRAQPARTGGSSAGRALMYGTGNGTNSLWIHQPPPRRCDPITGECPCVGDAC